MLMMIDDAQEHTHTHPPIQHTHTHTQTLDTHTRIPTQNHSVKATQHKPHSLSVLLSKDEARFGCMMMHTEFRGQSLRKLLMQVRKKSYLSDGTIPTTGQLSQRKIEWSSGLLQFISSIDLRIHDLAVGIKADSACSILDGNTKRFASMYSFTTTQARWWLSFKLTPSAPKLKHKFAPKSKTQTAQHNLTHFFVGTTSLQLLHKLGTGLHPLLFIPCLRSWCLNALIGVVAFEKSNNKVRRCHTSKEHTETWLSNLGTSVNVLNASAYKNETQYHLLFSKGMLWIWLYDVKTKMTLSYRCIIPNA